MVIKMIKSIFTNSIAGICQSNWSIESLISTNASVVLLPNSHGINPSKSDQHIKNNDITSNMVSPVSYSEVNGIEIDKMVLWYNDTKIRKVDTKLLPFEVSAWFRIARIRAIRKAPQWLVGRHPCSKRIFYWAKNMRIILKSKGWNVVCMLNCLNSAWKFVKSEIRFNTRNRFISFILMVSFMAFKLFLMSFIITNENKKLANASETTPTIYQYMYQSDMHSRKNARQNPTGFFESNGKLRSLNRKFCIEIMNVQLSWVHLSSTYYDGNGSSSASLPNPEKK